MTKRKLPQARMYLKAARYGFETMMAEKAEGYRYRFYIIGILASLRAVQHALKSHDSKLTPTHKAVINAWWKTTATETIPELDFIRTARNKILKGGSFESYAISGESGIGEGENYTITDTRYEIAYYDSNGERQDLATAIRGAISWCNSELTKLETKLPEIECDVD